MDVNELKTAYENITLEKITKCTNFEILKNIYKTKVCSYALEQFSYKKNKNLKSDRK